jgi:hypothetical protein
MQHHQVLSSPTSQGSFFLPPAQAVYKFARPASQGLLYPDRFDEEGGWYRLVERKGKLIAVTALPSGEVYWWSYEQLEDTLIQCQLTELFISLPLPQEAICPLPEGLAVRFLENTPLTHIASASLGEAVIKAVIRQVIAASRAKKLLAMLDVSQVSPGCLSIFGNIR